MSKNLSNDDNILQLRLLESEFNSKINEYKRTYETFLAYSKQHVEMEWDDKYPVKINNPQSIIDFNYSGDITKDECFANCANDDKCKYVLWSDSGKNTGFHCAPNKCEKYNDLGGGLINDKDGVTYPNPVCKGIYDNEKQSSFLTESNLLDIFPEKTNYKYYGWEKPTWQVNLNKSVTTISGNPDWKLLNNTKTIEECNNQANNLSIETPFDMVLYTPINNSDEGFCHGHIVKNKSSLNSRPQLVDSVDSAVSIPPGGQTGQIVAAKISIINNLNKLNYELRNILKQMSTILKKIEPAKEKNDNASKNQLKKIFKEVKRLKADREKIKALSDQLTTIDGQNESLKLKYQANQLLYLGMNVLFVGLTIITFKYMSSK
jgi:ribosomal protein S9|tara:strand:- start:3679 stop:4806 length:1128 start_codon:yes stop_codon:yes gene_type:complete